ncbi:hypothetical protein V6N12_041030 [Hibiscus sabdariffa]|uniref:Uncharacterized protein n=1 Tax=Hibiscus sabdariffa TaxID=183260 RepID=A0ABR2E5G4_9ROSI
MVAGSDPFVDHEGPVHELNLFPHLNVQEISKEGTEKEDSYRQVQRLQKELDAANADLIRYACNDIPTALPQAPGTSSFQPLTPRNRLPEFNRRNNGDGGGFYQVSGGALPYSFPWNDASSGDINDGGGEGEVALAMGACGAALPFVIVYA